MRIVLLTGPGGDAQGWGDMKVTESVREAAESLGYPTRIAYVADEAEFFRLIDRPDFDIVWSALYHITPNEKFIGRNAAGTWVADELDARRIPYIGSDSRTMKAMIDKFQTHEILAAGRVAVPAHVLSETGRRRHSGHLPGLRQAHLRIPVGRHLRRERRPQRRGAQAARGLHRARVRPARPGRGIPAGRRIHGPRPGQREDPGMPARPGHRRGSAFQNYRILRSDLRGVGLTRISLAGERTEEARRLADDAAEAMGCLDNVRIDMRVDKAGKLRIIEVNGIPGLKPHKSWAPQIYTLYHGSPLGEDEDYRRLIGAIVESARRRYGL